MRRSRLREFLPAWQTLLLASLAGFAACRSQTAQAPAFAAHAVHWPPGLRRPIDTWEGIHAFLVFDGRVDYRPTSDFLRHRFDFVWGAGRVVEPRLGPSRDSLLSYYVPANRATRGYNLTFDDRDHTLAWYQANHPDWVVYRCPGGVEPTDVRTAVPAYYMDENGDHLVPLDVSNPDVVSWQVEHFGGYASQLRARDGYDMLAVDNVLLDNIEGLCGIFTAGRFLRLYHPEAAHDPRWCADVAAWTGRLASALHALTPPVGLVANLAPLDGIDPTCLHSVTDHLDGVLDEGAFMRPDLRAPLDQQAWLARVHLMADLQHEGRAYYLINEFRDPPLPADFCATVVSPNELQWALASYLMGKEHSAGIFVSGLEQYGCSLWYPEFDARVGHPCGEMREESGTYVRDYSRGLVLVNPSVLAATRVLPAGEALSSLRGTPVSSPIQLMAQTGTVLVTAADAPSRCP